MISYRDETHT
jgi:mono/diheme cytochrome c family protein